MLPERPAPRLSRRASRRAEVLRAQAARAGARRTSWRQPRSDEGFAMSSPLAMVAATVVAAAGVAFFATDGAREVQQPREAALVTAPAPVEQPTTLTARKPRPVKVSRGDVYAEVYNNSNITGLAGSTSARMSGLGWQVVTTDNWYGTVPATTVYYPERLKKAAKLLAGDLGIGRVMPAVAPMSLDRLTVVLTADFA